MTDWERQEVKARIRFLVGFIVVTAFLIWLMAILSTPARGQHGEGQWTWPNSQGLAEHMVIERPDGVLEIHPVRCAPFFEDGSSYGCNSWFEGPGLAQGVSRASCLTHAGPSSVISSLISIDCH